MLLFESPKCMLSCLLVETSFDLQTYMGQQLACVNNHLIRSAMLWCLDTDLIADIKDLV